MPVTVLDWGSNVGGSSRSGRLYHTNTGLVAELPSICMVESSTPAAATDIAAPI